jgi:hypothetical protein
VWPRVSIGSNATDKRLQIGKIKKQFSVADGMADRIRPWIITLNNPTDEEIEALKTAVGHSNVVNASMALEVGENGTPHIQGWLRFQNGKTLSATKKFLGSKRYHLEQQYGSDYDAWFYTRKDGNILIEKGDHPKEGEKLDSKWAIINRLISDGADLLTILERYPDTIRQIGQLKQLIYEHSHTAQMSEWRDLDVTYIYGDSGTGKTRYVMDTYGYDKVYRVTDKKNPFDGYQGQEIIVFEEFRSSFMLDEMLNYLDGYPIQLPCRYANKYAGWVKVYIITNIDLNEQYERIQENHFESYNAFLRRIHRVWEFRMVEGFPVYDEHLVEPYKLTENKRVSW